MKTNFIFLFILVIYTGLTFGQTATIKGFVFDINNQPIENVSISYGNKGTTTNALGEYSLTIPSGKSISIFFSHNRIVLLLYKYTKKNKKSKVSDTGFEPVSQD